MGRMANPNAGEIRLRPQRRVIVTPVARRYQFNTAETLADRGFLLYAVQPLPVEIDALPAVISSQPPFGAVPRSWS
jgi:hypothetical protein